MTLSFVEPHQEREPTLSIIIVNWNSLAFLRACLESIDRTAGDLACEIVVVDNASFDGCCEMLQADFPGVVFLQSERNLGFAGANNLAFARSRGRNILFLNPDTELLPGALAHLLAALESSADAGMVGAQLLNTDGSLQTTCVTAAPSVANQTLNCNLLRALFPRWRMWGMRALSLSATEPVPVEAISGACMLARRTVLDRVGVFSTCYFMYAEDMDLSLKVRRLGCTILYVPQAQIVHHAGGSSSRRKESFFSDIVLRQSVLEYFVRHRGLSYARAYRATLALAAMFRLLLLSAAAPAMALRAGGRSFRPSLLKWAHILRWAVFDTPVQPVSRRVITPHQAPSQS